MASIPLDLQKRCERRWAARFFQPDPTTPKKPGPERQQRQTEPGKGKRKTHRLKPAGIRPAPTPWARDRSTGNISRRRWYLFCRANCCFVGLDFGNRAAGESLAAHRVPEENPAWDWRVGASCCGCFRANGPLAAYAGRRPCQWQIVLVLQFCTLRIPCC